ncbi:MAG: hypothetical protein AABX53_03610 [Nanoarchaeota archaeon]
MHTKRGLSDIVTAILIILLVLVAIGIIWAFLRPTITEGAGQLEGITDVYSTLLTIDSQSAQLDATTKVLSFVVSRGSGSGTIVGLTTIIEDGSGNAKSFRNETILGSLDSRRIYVNYSGSNLGTPVSIVVVPIIGTSGGKDRLGSESNTVSVSASSGGSSCTNGSTQACTYGSLPGAQQTCAGGAWGSCVCYADMVVNGLIDDDDYNFFTGLSASDPRADCNGDQSVNANDVDCFGALLDGQFCSWSSYCASNPSEPSC